MSSNIIIFSYYLALGECHFDRRYTNFLKVLRSWSDVIFGFEEPVYGWIEGATKINIRLNPSAGEGHFDALKG